MGGGTAGALALTRPTVMRRMLVLYSGCAALTRHTKMTLMLVLHGGCAGAYPPYENA